MLSYAINRWARILYRQTWCIIFYLEIWMMKKFTSSILKVSNIIYDFRNKKKNFYEQLFCPSTLLHLPWFFNPNVPLSLHFFCIYVYSLVQNFLKACLSLSIFYATLLYLFSFLSPSTSLSATTVAHPLSPSLTPICLAWKVSPVVFYILGLLFSILYTLWAFFSSYITILLAPN